MRLTQILRCTSKLPKDYANLPESYVNRVSTKIEWKTPKGRQYRKAVLKKPDYSYRYGMDRPWTQEWQHMNKVGTYYTDPQPKILPRTYFRGDLVEILVGDDKGKQGTINYIVPERNWVTVEGLNTVLEKRTTLGKTQYFRDEKPLLMDSQVLLVDPADERPTRIEWRYTEEGKRVRVSLRTGRIIPIPASAEATIDYKSKNLYRDKPKDTSAAELAQITFIPKLATFEMDIMEQHGIEDDRVPARTFWY